MSEIKRRRRTQCKLPCEIAVSAKRRVPGRIVTLSEGGLAVVTGACFEQGDPIRLILDPKGARPILVSAIVWNDIEGRSNDDSSTLRRFGCVISQPSDSFQALLDRMLPDEALLSNPRVAKDHSDTTSVAPPKPINRGDEGAEADLPRSRELQPPPKVEPEESLPYFRIRLKQIGGPRTRVMTLQARSATQAEQRALEELACMTHDATGWGVLHVAKVTGRR